jgi:serine phosphatase RsbU (regulator of sigma subunit)
MLVVVVVGLVVTAALTAASHVNYLHTEHRLTKLQTELTADALAVAPLDAERRLGTVTSLVSSLGAHGPGVTSALGSLVAPSGPYAAVDLFRVSGAGVDLEDRRGTALLAPTSSSVHDLTVRVARSGSLDVTHIVRGGAQRLGYVSARRGPAGTFVVYAEQVLPATRQVVIPSSNPDADLRVAIYFGRVPTTGSLLETNATKLPLSGTTATTSIPFGDSTLTLVSSPRGSLAGVLAQYIAWGIALVGALTTMAVALLADRLVRRRLAAEGLAEQNQSLFQAQRSVSETLQRSLLPARLAAPPGLDVAVRYLPATAGIDVGGDWYDVIDVGDRAVFFTIGDVAGKGLDAAILMSSLRNAINAYAVDGDPPNTVLAKVNRLVDLPRDGRFATVLCGTINAATGDVVLANAGHLEPVLVSGDHAEPVSAPPGPPVGVGRDEYQSVRCVLHPGDTLLAYTDGLIERRDEPLSAGLARLCLSAGRRAPLRQLVDDVVADLVPSGPSDDIAVLGIRWHE